MGILGIRETGIVIITGVVTGPIGVSFVKENVVTIGYRSILILEFSHILTALYAYDGLVGYSQLHTQLVLTIHQIELFVGCNTGFHRVSIGSILIMQLVIAHHIVGKRSLRSEERRVGKECR